MYRKFIPADRSFDSDRIFLYREFDEEGREYPVYFYFKKVDNYLFDEKRGIHWTKEKIIQHSLSKSHSDSFTQEQKDIQDKEYFDKYFKTHSFD